MSKWIYCKDRLPDTSKMELTEDDGKIIYASSVVLLYTKYGYYTLANPITNALKEKVWFRDYHFDRDYELDEIIAWMHFPGALEAEEDDKGCWNCKHRSKGITDNPCYECYRRLTDDGWEEEE